MSKINPKPLICHFTPMEQEVGDDSDGHYFPVWFVCKHCGCHKDENGETYDPNTGKYKHIEGCVS